MRTHPLIRSSPRYWLHLNRNTRLVNTKLRKKIESVKARRTHTDRGRRKGGVSKSRRSSGSENVAGGEKCGVNCKGDLVVVVAKASPGCPDDGHNRLLARHWCIGLQILCSSEIRTELRLRSLASEGKPSNGANQRSQQSGFGTKKRWVFK